MSKSIIEEVGNYVEQYFVDKVPTEYYYHSSDHVKNVVENAREIGKSYSLPPSEIEDLEIAAWFHDIGIEHGYHNHEERSAESAEVFLKDRKFEQSRIDRIKRLILSTKIESQPEAILEKIMKDADTSHVGKKDYFDKLALLKTEWEQLNEKKYSEKEWLQVNLEFLKTHVFFTPLAQSEFNKRKRKNIVKLQDRYRSLLEFENEYLQDAGLGKLKLRKPSERGIETMFRVTLRNHNHLSRIADNKANIMLSINAIMLSIVISSLSTKLDSNPYLVIPTIIIILVCLGSIILATIATRPKITSAKYTDEKFMSKRFNMLFFGNFYQLPLDKFEWGISELMEDGDLLYSSLTKDLYFLGLVLARKYRLLRITYNFFMIGLAITAVSFIVSFVMNSGTAT